MNWSDLKWLCMCDEEPGDGGFNMAMDEVLLRQAHEPTLRVYAWARPTVTFGYFEKLADARARWNNVQLMRRWTGGGQVDHRADFTYTVIIPANANGRLPLAREAYARIHQHVAAALQAAGIDAILANEDASVPNGPCFVKPVEADVMVNGRKIAGAAQRRNRLGMLHQGSIQGVRFPENWQELFIRHFPVSGEVPAQSALREAAKALAANKYDTPDWIGKF